MSGTIKKPSVWPCKLMNNVYCTKRNNDAQLKLLATRSKLGGRLNRVFQIMKKADFNTLFAADEQQDDQ